MNIHLVIHLDNFWVCCPALRFGTSAAFWKWGLLECMLLSSSVLIPPANAWPGRARSAGGNAHDRASSTGGTVTGPAAAAPPPASSAVSPPASARPEDNVGNGGRREGVRE